MRSVTYAKYKASEMCFLALCACFVVFFMLFSWGARADEYMLVKEFGDWQVVQSKEDGSYHAFATSAKRILDEDNNLNLVISHVQDNMFTVSVVAELDLKKVTIALNGRKHVLDVRYNNAYTYGPIQDKSILNDLIVNTVKNMTITVVTISDMSLIYQYNTEGAVEALQYITSHYKVQKKQGLT